MTLRLPVTFAATDRTDSRPFAMVAVVGDTNVRAGIEPM
jgi:hypothetical protein